MEINHVSRTYSKSIGNQYWSAHDYQHSYTSLPDHIDWREQGAVTPVENQGECGACYAFASLGALETQYWTKTGKLITLSKQQIIDCAQMNSGCNGGWISNTFKYIKQAGGIMSENDYPFVSVENSSPKQCKFDKENIVTTNIGFVKLPSYDEEAMKETVATIGPIAVLMSTTNSFTNHTFGVLNNEDCVDGTVNHSVLIVGYGVDSSNSIPYWLIKNSWGPNWGEEGYFRLQRNINACNIALSPVYPVI